MKSILNDFLSIILFIKSIYCLNKRNGFTEIKRASDNSLAKSLIDAGDLPGALWRQGLLTGE